MTPYGFVEVADGPDAYLQQMLELASRLSQKRRVVLRMEASVRPKVENMLQTLVSESDRARIELLDRSDRQAAIPAVQNAGFCVFTDNEMTAYLREDQVGIYSLPARLAS